MIVAVCSFAMDDILQSVSMEAMMSKLWFKYNQRKRKKIALNFGMPIRELELSARTLNALLRSNPQMTVGDLVGADESIAKIRNLGEKCIQELNSKASQLLHLAQVDEKNDLRKSRIGFKNQVLAARDANTIPVAVRNLGVESLNLNPRISNALISAHLSSIGDLVDYVAHNGYIGIPGFGANSQDVVENALMILTESFDGETIDWLKYSSSQQLDLIPKTFDSGNLPEAVVAQLPEIIKEILSREVNERAWIIIQRRFGLDGMGRLTLDELGSVFGLTRERIRQIEAKGLRLLHQVLIEEKYYGRSFRIHPVIAGRLRLITDTAINKTQHPILESCLLDVIHLECNLNTQRLEPSFLALFAIAGIERLEFDDLGIEPILGNIEPPLRKQLRLQIKKLDHILTREVALPLGEIDILLSMNRDVEKSRGVSLQQFRTLIDLCSSIEKREDDTIWGKFVHLKGRGNQIERILFEFGNPMDMQHIAREIDSRLVSRGENRVSIRTLANQLYSDGRFVPIGRSGLWGLKSWSNIETGNINELMEEFLISRNTPATIDEIYAYVSERRPVSRASILLNLSRKDVYRKVDRERWGLVEWSNLTDTNTWNPEQVGDFVARIFKKEKELDYKVVKSALMKTANVTEHVAQGLLGLNPVIKTYDDLKAHKKIAVFNPGYKNDLSRIGARFVRTKKTLRQLIYESAREILVSAPNKQMPLNELVSRLKTKHSAARYTIYAYVSNLDYLERVELPGGIGKLCRIKDSGQGIQFPQIEGIRDVQLRERILRAISFLDKENVDIGLFLLSKEFESVLKSYLVMAQSKGKLKSIPAGDSKNWKLAHMVDCAKANEIITDSGTLHLLRQERNDRAHGPMPSEGERQVLTNSAPYIGGLYLDYIKLFEDLSHALT
jgi:Bacterial RNA polymerase, alpha chain C terminal domain/Sigma-70, region 4